MNPVVCVTPPASCGIVLLQRSLPCPTLEAHKQLKTTHTAAGVCDEMLKCLFLSVHAALVNVDCFVVFLNAQVMAQFPWWSVLYGKKHILDLVRTYQAPQHLGLQ